MRRTSCHSENMGKRKRQDPPPKKSKRTSTPRNTRAQNTVTDESGKDSPTRSSLRRRNTNAAAESTAPQREPASAQADGAVGTSGPQPPHPRTAGECPIRTESLQSSVSQSNNHSRHHTDVDSSPLALEGRNRNFTSSTISSSFPSIVPNTNFLRGNMERESQPSQYGISQTDHTDLGQQNEQTSHTQPQGQGLPQEGPGAHSRTYHPVPHQSPLHPAGDRLGTSTPQNIREKIWKGEFIDLNGLVDSQYNATRFMQDVAEQERANLTVAQVEGTWVLKPYTPPPKNKIFSIEVWTNAFLVYMSIYIEAHPESVHDLLKYCHLIRSAASRYHGFGWRDYDTEFRHRLHRGGGTWATMDGELWLLHVVSGGSPRMARGVDYPPRFTRENRGTERRRYQPLTQPNRGPVE